MVRVRATVGVFALFAPIVTASAEPVRLVGAADYAPYAGAGLPDGGVATKLVRRAFEAVGRPVTVTFAPRSRAFQQVLSGDFDAAFPYGKTAARELLVAFSAPLMATRSAYFTAKTRPFAFSRPERLIGRTACVPVGYAMPDVFQALLEAGQFQRIGPDGSEACGRLLVAGRADFMIQDRETTLSAFRRAGVLDKIDVTEEGIPPNPFHLIAPKTPSGLALIAVFDAALARMTASGEYDAITRGADMEDGGGTSQPSAK